MLYLGKKIVEGVICSSVHISIIILYTRVERIIIIDNKLSLLS